MAKKIAIHTDAVLFLVLILFSSLGFNAYQRQQYSELMTESFDLEWERQNMEVNWLSAQRKWRACKKDQEITYKNLFL